MIRIDLKNNKVSLEEKDSVQEFNLDSPEAFDLISQAWLRCGWDTKYVYSFTWLGRPIIQLPEDLMRIQEVIFNIQPDVIIETGIAHGGSLIFYASLCKALNKGKVIGIEVEMRSQNKLAIENHCLSSYISIIEGSSIDPSIINQTKKCIGKNDKVLVLLDSCHTKQHVLKELEAYGPLISKGSYIVAMDGIMHQVVGAPRSQKDWEWNNPMQAAIEFVKSNSEYIIEEPAFLFNEGKIQKRITYWPSAFIKKI
ncbi:MAG: class I SAM-dependent methyltransferase [Parachlamydiales bacterium]|nr:class I SAM-dependent methyltransferase [Parachlamydiales bacterium]